MVTLMEMGQAIPAFTLDDLKGKPYSLKDMGGRILVLVFWSAECPWSERADALIQAWQVDWGEQVEVWMIASNRNEDKATLRQVAEERKIEVVLIDADAQLADLFGAVTTPHCFVIDEAGTLRYCGALDDVTFRQREATRFFLKDAVSALLSGKPVKPEETSGYGCTIVRVDPTGT
jgi:peroxiredoxin